MVQSQSKTRFFHSCIGLMTLVCGLVAAGPLQAQDAPQEVKNQEWVLNSPIVIYSSQEASEGRHLLAEPRENGIEFSLCESPQSGVSCEFATFLPFESGTHGELLNLIRKSDRNEQVVSWSQWGILIVGGAACIYFTVRTGDAAKGLLCGAGAAGLAFGGAYVLDEYVLDVELSTLDKMAINGVFAPLMNYEPEVQIEMSLQNYLRNIKIVESLLKTYSLR